MIFLQTDMLEMPENCGVCEWYMSCGESDKSICIRPSYCPLMEMPTASHDGRCVAVLGTVEAEAVKQLKEHMQTIRGDNKKKPWWWEMRKQQMQGYDLIKIKIRKRKQRKQQKEM